MTTPEYSNASVSLHKSTDGSGQLPPDLPPTNQYGEPLPQLLAAPRHCNAGAGMTWLTSAFAMFKENFLLWIGIGVVFFLIIAILGSIPFIGFIFSLAAPILIAGIIQGCAAQARGDELRFDHLFSGFKTHLQPLVMLCVLYLIVVIIAMIPFAIILVLLFGSMMAGVSDSSLGMIIIFASLSILLFVPVMMSIWFAPALIVLHDLEVIDAMKKSFKGCMANLVPMTVYGLVAGIALIVFITVTIGIGMLAAFPMLMLVYYTSYRDVWTDQPLSAA